MLAPSNKPSTATDDHSSSPTSHDASYGSGARAKLYEGLSRSANQTTKYLDSLKATIDGYCREHKLSETAAAAWGQEIDCAHATVEEIKRMSEDFRAEGDDISDDMINRIKAAVDDMLVTLNSFADRARIYETETMTVAHPSLGEQVKIKAEEIKEKIIDAQQSTQETLVDMMNSTRETARSGYERLKSDLASAQSTAADYATAAKDKVMEGANTVKSNLSSVADTATAKTSDKMNAGETKNEKGAHETKSAMGIEEPTMTERIVGGAKNLVGMSDPTEEPSTKDKVVGGAKDMKDNAKSKTEEAAHDTKKSVGVEEPTMTEKAMSALNSSLDYVASTFQSLKMEATSAATPTDEKRPENADTPLSTSAHP